MPQLHPRVGGWGRFGGNQDNISGINCFSSSKGEAGINSKNNKSMCIISYINENPL